MRRRLALFSLLAAAAALCACGGTAGTRTLPDSVAATRTLATGSAPFQHIVIAIQENRTFDNIFAGAKAQNALKPDVETTMAGYTSRCTNPNVVTTCKTVPLVQRGYQNPNDPDHSNAALVGECHVPVPSPPPANGTSPCLMNGFDREDFGSHFPGKRNKIAYAYLPVAQVAPYVALANSYAIADHLFSGARAPSFPGHMFLIAGLGPADDPPSSPWGCPEPASNTVPLFLGAAPVYPCFTFPTLATRLDAAKISWKYYTGETPPDSWDGLVNAYAAIKAIYGTAEYRARVVPRARFFDDVVTKRNGRATCSLPSVSWITPNGNASDHAGFDTTADGPYWVATLYEAIAQSPCYANTAFLVVWDDAGGWYDHVPPPYVTRPAPPGFFGYRDNAVGFRVPLLFVAPNAKIGVSKKLRDFGAIVRFVENDFGLPPLGSEDLDFGGDALRDMWVPHPQATITPIPVSQILVRGGRRVTPRYFLSQPPMPADDQ